MNRISLIVILTLCVLLKVYCSLDQYLHEWDERYHALVAKHLIDHPLKPMLYENPVEPFDHKSWTANHVWLSKPPLPLWFMAFSIKVFGTHEFAVRLPGIIFATLSVLLTYLIARKLFNERVAIVACFLHAIHGMLTDLASGRLSSDGVETCFLFFVELGMYWVFMRARGAFRRRDYILTGAITGLAVMCKWQPAFLVLVVMFVYHFKKENLTQHLLNSCLALFTSCLVFAPWCIYILHAFPVESRWMFHSLFTPFSDQSLGTDCYWYCYLTDFGNFFGYSTYLLLVWMFIKFKMNKNTLWLALLTWALLPLSIFSFASATRGTYIILSAPALFMIIAAAVDQPMRNVSRIKCAIPAMGYLSMIFISGYSIEKLCLVNPQRTRIWSEYIKNKQYEKGDVIYDEPHSIELMFYQDVTAYPFEQPVSTND
jgi:4-amino-4-deoxy-L-arabinose transferase-like glycosyltransferase